MAKNLRTLMQLNFDLSIKEDIMLLGLAYDSRKIQAGECFCAYEGHEADGRAYIKHAIESGACAVLRDSDVASSEPVWHEHQGRRIPVYQVTQLKETLGDLAAEFYGHPSRQVKVIGVTGTNGKTSFCHLFAKAMQSVQKRCGILGSLGNGFLNQLTPSENTTLNAIDVQQQLAQMRDKGAEYVAMEVSSHALDQGRVNGVDFHLTVFTNLTQDHLDYHGSMECYAKAKQRLFVNAVPAVINIDDNFGTELIMQLKQPVTVFSLKHLIHAEVNQRFVQTINLELYASGFKAFVNTSWGDGEFISHLVGEFNVSNCLAVLSALLNCHIPFDDALKAMQTLEPVPGRMECFDEFGKPMVFVDYAHTPDALAQSLKILKPLCRGKLYCVFGCGGDRDASKRHKMAKIVKQHADKVIVTQDNVRHENPDQIIADIMLGFDTLTGVTIEQNRSAAIAYAVRSASADDIILVAGKGREEYLLVKDIKHPYSDIDEVEKCLKESECYIG